MTEHRTVEHQIGAHLIRREGDVLLSTVRGAFTPEDAAAYFHIVEQVLAEHGRYFMLIDMSRADTIPAETRRASAEFGKAHPAAGVVVWGSNFAVRVLFTLVVRAISVFRPDAGTLVFVRSEEEARAWVEGRRAALLANQAR
jgi:hypothetical protein